MLRFVLAGEGYDVVADAANPAELARVLAVHKPDVVVLDDGIGATTVTMVHDMLPGAKMILVWPEAVSPIAGASRVEPVPGVAGPRPHRGAAHRCRGCRRRR
jgi:DNA-binding NarL/FixJ family response regulator